MKKAARFYSVNQQKVDELCQQMKGIDVAKEYFPDATEGEAGYILWNETGFPAFWRIPEDGNTPEECLRKQLADFKAKSKEGIVDISQSTKANKAIDSNRCP
ncbi:MAG TPA: hypothetical protein VMW01_00875 [Williamwhitmania sp.]|nr:hypothetical protein [Williamwhitmania sp.]